MRAIPGDQEVWTGSLGQDCVSGGYIDASTALTTCEVELKVTHVVSLMVSGFRWLWWNCVLNCCYQNICCTKICVLCIKLPIL